MYDIQEKEEASEIYNDQPYLTNLGLCRGWKVLDMPFLLSFETITSEFYEWVGELNILNVHNTTFRLCPISDCDNSLR